MATGYNRSLTISCDQVGKCIREENGIAHGTRYEVGDCLHSEIDALLFCAREGKSCKSATLYINGIPCLLCARQILVAGITRVVVKKPSNPNIFPVLSGLDFLKEFKIEVVLL